MTVYRASATCQARLSSVLPGATTISTISCQHFKGHPCGELEVAEFDAPLFKKLAHNDTGAAVGHQAGVVIPKDMDRFFPDLGSGVTASSPTVDENIRAALFVGDTPVGVVSTRYQYQTWGGARPPERRITGNLTALRNAAAADDYLIIERSTTDPTFYRLRLLRAGTPAYANFAAAVSTRRWGPVDKTNLPVTEKAVLDAEADQAAHEGLPLDLFDNGAVFTESRTRKIARSRAFQHRVSKLYKCRCAVCEKGLISLTGPFEVEAAHIVPRSLKGADDARNGLALCRSHHWAFDHGLFGINNHGEISIPPKIAAIAENLHLVSFAAQPLKPPSIAAFAPSPEALSWHMTNIVGVHL